MTPQPTYSAPADFEELYFVLRQKEGRLYTDEEVLKLPFISVSHAYYPEWLMRKQSSDRLIKYLTQKKQSLKILEVGCGNGWLSHRLAKIPQTRVTGIDINFYELQQAAKVFSDIPNLQFIYTNIQSGAFKENQFDIVVFAASIQYFSSLSEILQLSLQLLRGNGEIHILDSHFYDKDGSSTAKKRTHEYFSRLGLPELSSCYYHHTATELQKFNHKILYKAGNGFFSRRQNPFPWIVIRNDSRL